MAVPPEEFVVVPTGRHGLPANVVAAHQRQRLIMATIELVAKHGYRATSIDHIVKRAKVGYVAFYELFDGKEACFAGAFELIVAEAHEQLAAAVTAGQPWPEQICAGLQALVELIAANPERARVALVEAPAAGPAAYSRYEEAIEGAIPMLRAGRALRAGTTELSQVLEEAIIGGIVWIFHERLVKDEAKAIPEMLSEAVLIALAPYLGEAEAQRIAGGDLTATN
jgi:AcrR family transcriptional regulator